MEKIHAMRRYLVFLLLLNVAANAQQREVGVLFQPDFSDGNRSFNMLGVQYKGWKNDHKGFRALAAYGDYLERENAFFVSAAGDTSVKKHTEMQISLAVLGGGIEMQRQFYKRVHLFAALEINLGYGSGTQDTIVEWNFLNSAPTGVSGLRSSAGSANISMLYGAVRPTIGATIRWNKLVLGVEITAIEATFRSLYASDGTTSYAFFGADNLSNRLFVHYRF